LEDIHGGDGILREDKIMFTFWKKNDSGLPGPKGVPDPVYRDIVTQLGGNPDKISALNAVIRPKEGEQNTFEVRVFDKGQAGSQKITVKDYNSLTDHPELILYEGWYNKTAQAEIRKRR
jgi:hypothetical protein